ncbi:hypothetical protein [Allorhodopirellula solitaria]|uniref:Uncharacterized protein n=1 Tax=Allorhodopirellula solitaria TaxID=2527987 RepID=A0A5C5X0U8_9BACT|nr:hypothetical protein [Allorhodopirellula solitaria]TWT56430.1 hypothetical protein CA85_42430 [Allorhodopirellula solitaria]
MNQNDLNRAVARATGETISAVKRLGFMIANPSDLIDDPTDPVHGGRVIDWDDFEFLQDEPDENSFVLEAAIG